MPLDWSQYETAVDLRQAIVAHSRSFNSVRFRHQGRCREFGLDCLGLLLAVAKDFGFAFSDRNDYSLAPASYRLVECLSQFMDELSDWRTAQPGDVVLMKFHVDYPPQHIVIVAENNRRAAYLIGIHSARQYRKVVEGVIDRTDLITHAFRIRELTQLADRRRQGTN